MDHRAGASQSRLRRSLLQLGDTILQEFINAPHGVVLVARRRSSPKRASEIAIIPRRPGRLLTVERTSTFPASDKLVHHAENSSVPVTVRLCALRRVFFVAERSAPSS